MKRKSYRFFALSIVFLASAIVFYNPEELSFAKFLIFLLDGVVVGLTISNGVIAWRREKE